MIRENFHAKFEKKKTKNLHLVNILTLFKIYFVPTYQLNMELWAVYQGKSSAKELLETWKGRKKRLCIIMCTFV